MDDSVTDRELASCGECVEIDSSARLFGADHIHIGSNVRIDCFCVITAGPADVVIGDHVHISASAQLFGTHGIQVEDFASVSAQVAIFSTNDDYLEGFLANPTVPDECRKVRAAPVTVGRAALIGAGTVVLPGVSIGKGSAVGALTVVGESVEPYEVVAGNPRRGFGKRDAARLEALEARVREAEG